MSDSCLPIPKRTQKVLQDEPAHPMPRGVAQLWLAEMGSGTSHQRPAATCWQECRPPGAKNWARGQALLQEACADLGDRHATTNSLQNQETDASSQQNLCLLLPPEGRKDPFCRVWVGALAQSCECQSWKEPWTNRERMARAGRSRQTTTPA